MNTKYYAVGALAALLVVAGSVWTMNSSTAVAPDADSTTTPPGGVLPSIAPYTSGVKGTVMLTRTCGGPDPLPAYKPGAAANPPTLIDCADTPYATIVSALKSGSDGPYAVTNSDEKGAFMLNLPPGVYTLRAGDGAKLPLCAKVTVTVIADSFVTAAIVCDSGMR